MTSQRILVTAMAWKSLTREILKADFDTHKTFSGEQVTKLLNSLIDWLVNCARIEERQPVESICNDDASRLLEAARDAQP